MEHEEKQLWLNFIAELEEAQRSPEDRGKRADFASRLRSELAILSFWLSEVKVTGGGLHVAADPPNQCDLCGTELSETGLFIDGQITDGRWSFMCMICYGRNGTGIGWGIGQLCRLAGKADDGHRRWICIAGRNPDPDDDHASAMA